MDKLKQLIEKKKKDGKGMSKNQSKAKGSVLEDLISAMDGEGASKLKGLKSDTSAPSAGGDSRGGDSRGGDKSDTSTDSNTRTRTATSTKAFTKGNVTVTGGAGRGANTTVHLHTKEPTPDDKQDTVEGEGAGINPPVEYSEEADDGDDDEISELKAEIERLKSLIDKPRY